MTSLIRHVQVSRLIRARPDEVWAAIADVTRMGEWSPECYSCSWEVGYDGPTLGAVFVGHNRHGEFEWSTRCEVVACDPGQIFAFDAVAGDLRFAHWSYRIEPAAHACLVTESWDEGRPPAIIERSRLISGVAERDEHNRLGMSETLDRLARCLEPS